ncbi:MAG: acireductone dioxygenase [Acidobacteriota bacterium]
MAILSLPEAHEVVRDPAAIARRLAGAGIDLRRWTTPASLPRGASAAAILEAYAAPIEALKREAGYVTADVIDVHPDTPGLEAMLARFAREHWHQEDEVRFVIAGRGLFHIRPPSGPVLAVQVEAGDLLRVPRKTRHWFHLCPERRIRAIRLFQDPAGWVPHFTGSGAEDRHAPVCLGREDLPGQV